MDLLGFLTWEIKGRILYQGENEWLREELDDTEKRLEDALARLAQMEVEKKHRVFMEEVLAIPFFLILTNLCHQVFSIFTAMEVICISRWGRVSRRLTCGPSPPVGSLWAPGGQRRREPSPGRSTGALTPTGSLGSGLSLPPLHPGYQSSHAPAWGQSTWQSRWCFV